MKIKALTLWQPWASLVALGEKRYETRAWKTDYRGLLAIHAAQRWPTELDTDTWISGTLARHGYRHRHQLPVGKVLCVCMLLEVLPAEEILARANVDVTLRINELHFGDYSPGRWAWRLEVIRLPLWETEARGHQGLWDWEVPADLVGHLQGYLEAQE